MSSIWTILGALACCCGVLLAGCSDPAEGGTVTLVSAGGPGAPGGLSGADGSGSGQDTAALADSLVADVKPADASAQDVKFGDDLGGKKDALAVDAVKADAGKADVTLADGVVIADGTAEPDLGPQPDPGPEPDPGPDPGPDPDPLADVGADAGSDAAVDAGPVKCTNDVQCPAGTMCANTPDGPICQQKCKVVGPKQEACNGEDDNCNGQTDEGSCEDANQCTYDVCKPALGGCQHVMQPGLPCDADGSACTLDACQGVGCLAGPAKLCSDGKPCTVDLCNPASGQCSSSPKDGAACDDGNTCTGPDFCQGDSCQSGPIKFCSDGNSCTMDSCNANLGLCQYTAVAVGTACEDGTACTQGDTCFAGVCTGKPISCDDKSPCTADQCDPKLGCLHPPLDGIACDDGLPCTKGEVCQGGQCKNGGIVGCSDGNPCTVDSCDPVGGCKHVANFGACDDGTACTQGESCATGVCAGGKNLNCEDQNPCTDDSCSATAGCQHVPHVGPCNDGNLCTSNDFCQGGSCVAGTPLNCNDGIACTLDDCNPIGGGCLHTAQNSLCDDGFACTKDTCTPGGCAHDNIPNCCGGKNCDPGDVCVVYPDTLVPFCAKPCNSGADCPGTCCHMAWPTKHCLPPTYQAECCGTTEYWATDAEPYKCGKNGTGHCTEYPNPQPPYYPSKITHCDTPCKANKECPGSCCGSTTLGTQLCIWSQAPYPSLFCPNM